MTSKVFQSRAHRERAQPANRARLGLLEKKSDYLQRARDHQSKRQRIKAMKIRAAYKNPDEFYFKMQSTKRDAASGRVRVAGEHEKLSAEVIKLMKSQDLQSLRELLRVNERKLEQLKFEHNSVSDESSSASSSAKHTKFVVDDEELADLIISTATQKKELKRQAAEDAKLRTAPEAVKAEFAARSERLAQLRVAVKKLEQEQLAAAKGRKKKVGEDANGIPVYKFDPIRKK